MIALDGRPARIGRGCELRKKLNKLTQLPAESGRLKTIELNLHKHKLSERKILNKIN